MPLDTEKYVTECTEKLSHEMGQTTWGGAKAAQEQDVAWVTTLALIANMSKELPTSLPAISIEKLSKAEREDSAVGEVLQLKETNAGMRNEIRQTLSKATRRLTVP